MRRLWRNLKLPNKTLLVIHLILTSLFWGLFLNPFNSLIGFALTFAFTLTVLSLLLQRLKGWKRAFGNRIFFTLHLVVLLLILFALLGQREDFLRLHPFDEGYLLFFVGSIVGVLSKTFMRTQSAEKLIFLATLEIFLASKNIFATVGFLLGNLISADIYSRKRDTLWEIGAVAVGNLVFTAVLVGYWLQESPSCLQKVFYLYPLSVVSEIFVLFGLQKLLDLLPFMYSDEKLEKLANISHPLIEKMMLEAPGTYHHSVMVSLLAESVAKKLGADALLTRVGAMFHDIGKLVNPQYFIENVNGENPHKGLKPEVSASIIKNHVEEGLALAKKYNLPEEIVRFIPEHQGTKLIKYFYYQALKENPSVDEGKFRYAGPIPQSKETAIVMITDTVEAMVRALKNPTADDIRRTVQKAIEILKEEGQLNASNLGEEELQTIEKLLTELLLSYYHERIKYPEKPSGERKL